MIRFPLLPLLAACGQDGTIDESSVTATVSDLIRSVVTVTWTAPDAGEVSVEYGPDGTYGFETPVRSATGADHAVTLYGLAVGSVYHYRVAVTVDGERYVGADHSVKTGTPEESPRDFEIVQPAADGWDRFVMTGSNPLSPPGDVVIYNPAGQLVWYWHAEAGQPFHPRRAANGSDILFHRDNSASLADNYVARVSMDGERYSETPTPFGHHDYVEVPGIQFAYIQADVGEWEGEPVVGDKIVEVLEDGTSRDVWVAFDEIAVTPHAGWEYDFYPQGRDWTHANGLAYDETDDAYYLSLYWMEQILKIDRATGDVLWILGDGGDFAFVGDDGFGPQHGPQPVDGGIMLFDNDSGPGAGSRLVRYALDTDAWTAELVWSWSREGLLAGTMGDANLLDDGTALSGTVLSAWGDAGNLIAISPSDEVVWELDHEPATVIGHVEALDSLYPRE